MVRISDETKAQLFEMGKFGESYGLIIAKLCESEQLRNRRAANRISALEAVLQELHFLLSSKSPASELYALAPLVQAALASDPVNKAPAEEVRSDGI